MTRLWLLQLSALNSYGSGTLALNKGWGKGEKPGDLVASQLGSLSLFPLSGVCLAELHSGVTESEAPSPESLTRVSTDQGQRQEDRV